MKRKILGLLIFLALTLAACTSAPTPVTVIVEPTGRPAGNLPQTEADVPRVTVEEALTALNSGAAVIVDVRSVESFVARHIAGALSIPLDRIEENPQDLSLNKNQWIITYCT
ncbi:MAG: rhodanese-like domain-containing protein [Chloroflexi bacterium]|nr:rhodanese-like domain-containing protein [Chloroflexota bacterium]